MFTNIYNMDRTLEDMARTLVESGGYRIIRRLGPQTEYHSPDDIPKLIGAMVDVETTATDIARDKIIELGMRLFLQPQLSRQHKRVNYTEVVAWSTLCRLIDLAEAWNLESKMPDPEAQPSVSRSAATGHRWGYRFPIRPVLEMRGEQSAQRALLGRVIPAPFVDDVGLVADTTPDADLTDVLAVFGAAQMVVPPFEHPLATAGSAK